MAMGLLIQLNTWLGLYCFATPGVQGGDNATVRLDLENEVQPDGLLRLEPELGGKSRVTEDHYLEGPPELVLEIAASSASTGFACAREFISPCNRIRQVCCAAKCSPTSASIRPRSGPVTWRRC
jgi:Putative restriction endonuclease